MDGAINTTAWLVRSDVEMSGAPPPSSQRRPSQAIVEWQKLRCYNGGMSKTIASLTDLSDQELIAEVSRAAAQERSSTTHLIALLAEVDARRLYLGAGCSSLFTYCTQVLQLSEHAAYGRIEAARASRRFPVILQMLGEGLITLTTIGLLAPHLTTENHPHVLGAARHKSKREVEHMVAALHPRPAVMPSVRKLPDPAPAHRPAIEAHVIRSPDTARPIDEAASSCSSPTPIDRRTSNRPAVVIPLAPERYKVQFTVSRDTYDKLRRVQDLMRHSIPRSDLPAIFDRALTLLLKERERTKLAVATRARPSRPSKTDTRHIPASIKRVVWARDNGQCAFVGTNGRCSECGFLEFHHVVPFARGGKTVAENLELRCRAHNVYEAERWFGPSLVQECASAYAPLGPDRVVGNEGESFTRQRHVHAVEGPASGR